MVKNPPDDMGGVRNVGSIPGLGRSPGEGHGNPLQYSCLYSASDMQTTPPLRQKAEELSSLLMKEETEKAGLKLNVQKTKIMTSGPITSWQIHGETMETETLFWGAPKSLQMVTAAIKLKNTPWKKSYEQPKQLIKKQRDYFANKGPYSQSYGFSSSHVWM